MSTSNGPTIVEAFNRLEKASEAWDTGDNKQLMDEYNKQIDSYDADVSRVSWKGPYYTAETVEKYINDRNAHLLDVCGGTGAVAKLLREKDYTNIDYLDGSIEMTRAAMKNGYYETYICQIIPEDERTIVRSGGYFIAAIVETTEIDEKEARKVMEFFDQLASEGLCHTVETTKVDSMILRHDGSPAPGHVMVLQRNI